MIPKPFILRWQEFAPWNEFSQIEQDLIISRTLVDIFSDSFLRENLAFRGGTALHKLYLKPAPRYSEDIDLVQIKECPIKPILKRLNEVISFFEEDRRTQVKAHGAKVLCRFTSEYERIRMRLKIEINCWEHFNVLGFVNYRYKVENDWFSGQADIRTYEIEELLGTKLRALYQRKKGRDLFDLYYAHQNLKLDIEKILKCYKAYFSFNSKNKHPEKKEFLLNIEEKKNSPDFNGDMEGLLRPQISYQPKYAFDWLKNDIVEIM